MQNILIITDSSVNFNSDFVNNNPVTVVPLTIIHNNEEYLDQINLNYDQVNDLLRKKTKLQTSQPNLGRLISLFEEIKEKNYDHVYVVSLSSNLSGTLSSFNKAIEETGLNNVTLIDSYSIGGINQHIIKTVLNLNANDASHSAIMEAVNSIIDNTTSYVYPETLEQLKVSGRISKSAATMASLLKIKPILKLENKGVTIEKFATARTDSKVVETVIEDLDKLGFNPKHHCIYMLENEAQKAVDLFSNALENHYTGVDIHVIKLPAVVAVHGGIGTLCLQWCPK